MEESSSDKDLYDELLGPFNKPRDFKYIDKEPEQGVFYNLRKDGYPKDLDKEYMFKIIYSMSGEEVLTKDTGWSAKSNQADKDWGMILDGVSYK